MLKPSGYSIITDPSAARPVEHDTFSCAHCGKVEFVQAGFGDPQVVIVGWQGDVKMSPAKRCWQCFEWVCLKADCQTHCTPKFKAIEIEEKKQAKLILP